MPLGYLSLISFLNNGIKIESVLRKNNVLGKYAFYRLLLCLPHRATEPGEPGFKSDWGSALSPSVWLWQRKPFDVGKSSVLVSVSMFSWSSQGFKHSAYNAGYKCYFNSLHITRLPIFPGHPSLKAQSLLTCHSALSPMAQSFFLAIPMPLACSSPHTSCLP